MRDEKKRLDVMLWHYPRPNSGCQKITEFREVKGGRVELTAGLSRFFDLSPSLPQKKRRPDLKWFSFFHLSPFCGSKGPFPDIKDDEKVRGKSR